MPALLTTASTMMCPHGGTVTAVPGQSQATAGAPILRMSDTCTIAGCAFVIGVVPSPCVTVQWVQAATRVQAGDFALNEASVGLCLAATQAPQGSVLIQNTQPSVSGL
ncbi:MAG TPA: hypothetical protein VGJ21_07130 [Terracidiphilus sp.]|jgi:hypothetical protein